MYERGGKLSFPPVVTRSVVQASRQSIDGVGLASGLRRVQQSKSNKGGESSGDGGEQTAGEEAIERWLVALRWRRGVERALAPLRLTLAQWLVLDALARLIRETNDAVSQSQVARHLEMDRATVCQVMQRLERRGLVDQAPEFEGPAYRIYLTDVGKNAARQGRARVQEVSLPPRADTGAAPEGPGPHSGGCFDAGPRSGPVDRRVHW